MCFLLLHHVFYGGKCCNLLLPCFSEFYVVGVEALQMYIANRKHTIVLINRFHSAGFHLQVKNLESEPCNHFGKALHSLNCSPESILTVRNFTSLFNFIDVVDFFFFCIYKQEYISAILCYIFTSGTTGNPKPALIKHYR